MMIMAWALGALVLWCALGFAVCVIVGRAVEVAGQMERQIPDEPVFRLSSVTTGFATAGPATRLTA